jgi:hypothetical protein
MEFFLIFILTSPEFPLVMLVDPLELLSLPEALGLAEGFPLLPIGAYMKDSGSSSLSSRSFFRDN